MRQPVQGEQASVTQPSQPVTPRDGKQADAGAALVTMLSLLLLLAVVFGSLFVFAVVRRRRRMQELNERPRAERRTPLPDAWAEAGRRVEGVTTEELREQAGALAAAVSESGPSPGATRRPVAMITGAARRVGRSIALELARSGCDIVFTYNASADDADHVAREISQLGAIVSFYKVDLSDTDAMEAFAASLADTLPRVDILVHNASTYEPSPITDLTSESAMKQYRVNALAPLLLTARLAPLLERSILPGGGAVIAMGDIHALGRPRRDFAAYSMSKAALHELVRSLSRDLAPKVRVNAVAPGVIAWPENGFESDVLAQEKYTRRIPLGRAGSPEDAAKAIRWLAFDAPYVTGEIIRIDGGRWLT